MAPLRTNAKSPGEYIRDFLAESPGQRAYVGAIFRGYKEHLKEAGVAKLPCRQTIHTYIYLLRGTGAIVYDGAEAIAFGGEDAEPEELPEDYIPACGMPAPRHYYRLAAFDHPAFLRPKSAWREAQGLPAETPARRPRPRVITTAVIRPVVPSVSLPTRFTTRSVPRLVDHLGDLATLAREHDWPDENWPEMAAQVQRLLESASDWRDTAQDNLDQEQARERPNPVREDSLQERADQLQEVVDNLENQDLEGARDALEGISAVEAALAVPEEELPTEVAPAPTPPPRRRRRAGPAALFQEGQGYIQRLEALREPGSDRVAAPAALEGLEEEMLDYFDRVLTAAERATGEDRRRLTLLGSQLERASESFEAAQEALRTGDEAAYQAALDLLVTCCVTPNG